MKKLFRSKKMIIGLIVVLLIVGWFIHKRQHPSAQLPMQDSVLVEAKKVSQGHISIEAKTVGTLVASKSIQVTPEVAGKVSSILVHDGELVKQGTPLIQLDDQVYKAKAESAKGNLTYISTNYKRMVLLDKIKKGVISQQDIDKAFADLKEKKALVEETSVLAQKMLLVAPFEGRLGKIKINPGEFVNVAQPLVSLTDIHHLRVEFAISEKYLRFIKQGQQVILTTTAFPGKQFYGKIGFISPTINTEDRTVALYADVPNEDDRLTAGLFMNVTHLLGQEDNALLIPAVSLVATIDGQQVYKVVNGKAVAQPIKIGQRTTDQVQILEGLTLNDTVVTSGQQKIKDGMPVKIKN